MWGCGGDYAVQPHSMGGVKGGRGGTHTGTHTGTYTRMLYLPFSDLPLKKCPKKAKVRSTFSFEKVCVNMVVFWYVGMFGCFFLSLDVPF